MTTQRIIKNIANNTYKHQNSIGEDVNWRVKQLLVRIISVRKTNTTDIEMVKSYFPLRS